MAFHIPPRRFRVNMSIVVDIVAVGDTETLLKAAADGRINNMLGVSTYPIPGVVVTLADGESSVEHVD